MAASAAARANQSKNRNERMQMFNTIGATRDSLHADLIGAEEDEAHHWLQKKDSLLARQAAAAGFLVPKETRVLKEGKLFKLTSNREWVEKMVTVTHTQMTLATTAAKEEDALQDYIPLHKIQKVSFSSLSHTESDIRIEEAATEPPTLSRHQSGGPNRASTGSADGNGIFFKIHTSDDDNTAGRVYAFKTNSTVERREWVALLSSQSERRQKEIRKQEIMQYYRDKASRIYEHGATQALVALLIMISFGVNAYQAEFHPKTLTSSDGEAARVYNIIDICLTTVFVLELVFNIFAHWFWAFVLDGWNLFDFAVVGVSAISLLIPALPGLSFLRVLRAFRVLRLIRRFRSLKRIFDALVLSIIPVLNAFFISMLITFIYTIIGVFLFSGRTFDDFGTFNRSLMTLFMVVTSGSWPDVLPLMKENGYLDKVVFAYLFSFVASVIWTCLQVVVTVLLDNFLSVTIEDKRNEAIRDLQERRTAGSPLEPLLRKLALNFDAPDDLRRDIEAVFHMLDVDDSGLLSDTEMLAGFAKLKLTPKIAMTVDECKTIKMHTLACGEDAELSLELFETLMLAQLRDFVQRSLHDAFVMNQGDPAKESMIAGLKLNLVQDVRGASKAPGSDRRIADLQQQIWSCQAEVQSMPQRIGAMLREQQGTLASTNEGGEKERTLRALASTNQGTEEKRTPRALHSPRSPSAEDQRRDSAAAHTAFENALDSAAHALDDTLDSAAHIVSDAVHLAFPEHDSPYAATTSVGTVPSSPRNAGAIPREANALKSPVPPLPPRGANAPVPPVPPEEANVPVPPVPPVPLVVSSGNRVAVFGGPTPKLPSNLVAPPARENQLASAEVVMLHSPRFYLATAD